MGAQRVLMVVRGASLFEAPSNQQQNQQNQQQPTQISRSKLQNSPKQSPRSIQAKQSPRVVYPSPRNINYTNLESTSARKSAPPVELSIMMTKLEADFMEIGEKGRWKCSIREGSLLEDWLNLMLQRGAPSISVVSEANAQTIDNNIKGLQEYGLSRTQLMSWGLSESQIDRVYRMLYVYPIGCQELLKELCMHCVEKSLLVGSFWRAFIRLCEERSKMKLQAEISGLMEQKENAINELRLVRGCLNEALDGIAFKKLVDVNSSEKEMSSDSSTGSKEFVGATSIQLKETEAQLEALSGMCDHIHRERQQLLDQVEVMAKKLRIEKVALAVAYFKEREKAAEVATLKETVSHLKTGLDQERFQVEKLQNEIKKLEHDIFVAEKSIEDVHWEYVHYETEFPKMKKEVIEQKEHIGRLEKLMKRYENENKKLKEENAIQEIAISDLTKDIEGYAGVVNAIQSENNKKICAYEETSKDVSLTKGELEAWIKGHEVLLSQQAALIATAKSLREALQKEKAARFEEQELLLSQRSEKEEAMHSLGLALAVVKSHVESYHAERKRQFPPSNAKLVDVGTRDLERRKRSSQRFPWRDSSSFPQAELSHDAVGDDISDDGLECSALKTELEKMEANLKEEQDRVIWMGKQMEETSHKLHTTQAELDETSLRFKNLLLEKRSKEHNLENAEKEIQKLRECILQMEAKSTKEIEKLQATLMGEKSEKFTVRSMLTSAVNECEYKMAYAMEYVQNQVGNMLNRIEKGIPLLRNFAATNRSLRHKLKTLDFLNMVLLKEKKNLKEIVEKQTAENCDLRYKLQEEQTEKTNIKNTLTEREREFRILRHEFTSFKKELESTTKIKNQIEKEKESLKTEIHDVLEITTNLKNEKLKGDAVRQILQGNVDKLYLELETIKRAQRLKPTTSE